ncbi:hypothetical protein GSY74_05985, partial [Sulfurovum sp. bin170]|uniref:hypothetical protein n=1 Tax=Sulfurovum sp. bin170 TaxID=2695268 RepID=UPI0013DF13EA
MKRVQSVKSLSLMSSNPMGLLVFRMGGVFSFAETVLRRVNPIFLTIKNDAVLFFLYQNLKDNIVYYQHWHKHILNHSHYNSLSLLSEVECIDSSSTPIIKRETNLDGKYYNKPLETLVPNIARLKPSVPSNSRSTSPEVECIGNNNVNQPQKSNRDNKTPFFEFNKSQKELKDILNSSSSSIIKKESSLDSKYYKDFIFQNIPHSLF